MQELAWASYALLLNTNLCGLAVFWDGQAVLARGLLEYETLTGDEINALLKGIPPVRTPYEDPVLPARGEGTSVPVAGKPRPAAPGPGPIVSPA